MLWDEEGVSRARRELKRLGSADPYISSWYAPSTLSGNVTATYVKNAKNAQLVISHVCRPFTRGA